MTISSEDIRTNATATAGQTAFTFDFLVYDGDHVGVYVDEVKQTSGFSVTLDTPNDLPSKGTVNFSPDPSFAGGESVVMLAEAPYTQPVDLTNAGTLAEENVEQMADRVVRLSHQLIDQLKRAIKFKPGSTHADVELPDPGAEDEVLAWDAAGQLKNLGASNLADLILEDNEVAIKLPSQSIDGLAMAANTALVRAGGNIEALSFGANTVFVRAGGNIEALSIPASRLFGRAASGALKAMTPAEIRTVAGIANHNLFVVDADGNVSGYGQTIVEKTADFTLDASLNGKTVECNKASAINVTVPVNASVNLPVGFSTTLLQTGVGQVTVVADTGVTVRTKATGGLKIIEQWDAVIPFKRATDEWVLLGATEA